MRNGHLALLGKGIWLLVLCVGCSRTGTTGDLSEPLVGLNADHPRLIASDSDIDIVADRISSKAEAALLYSVFSDAARELGEEKPVFFPARGNNIGRARLLLKRVYLLGLLYRLSEDPEQRQYYAELAWRQLSPATRVDSWKTDKTPFLAVGEAMHALAIGYDWFYSAFDEEQHKSIRDAIVNNGLSPYLDGVSENAGWVSKRGNWAFVCHGGAVIAALAIASEMPELATDVMTKAIPALESAFEAFGADGAWYEGPTYWGYATRYAVYTLASLTTSLGNDFGLAAMPGFEETGAFFIYLTGSSGATFNFGDADEDIQDQAQLLWLARRFDKPLYSWFQREHFLSPLLADLESKETVLPRLEENSRPYALNLLWYDDSGDHFDLERLERSRVFLGKGVSVAALRTGWSVKDMTVAIRAGDNGDGHGHLDLGSFVLDYDGQRWVSDLGKDDYSVPGYFDTEKGKRWKIHRVGTPGHNTLQIDGMNQVADATVALPEIDSQPQVDEVTIDLSPAYGFDEDIRITRTFSLDRDHKRLTLVDQIDAEREHSVRWAVHTKATVELDGDRAILKLPGARAMEFRAVEPDGAIFKASPAAPGEKPRGQNKNSGVTKLYLEEQLRQGHTTTFHIVASEFVD
jgi:hypothetical protein